METSTYEVGYKRKAAEPQTEQQPVAPTPMPVTVVEKKIHFDENRRWMAWFCLVLNTVLLGLVMFGIAPAHLSVVSDIIKLGMIANTSIIIAYIISVAIRIIKE